MTHFAAIALFCLFGAATSALAQTSGPSSPSGTAPSGAASPGTAGAPASVPSGIGPAPAPTPGQSITIPSNTRDTPQGIGPAPAPTPGQSVSMPGHPRRSASEPPGDNAARPVQTPRQSRLRNARTPRDPTTVGSGSARPEHPARPERFVTPSIVNETGRGGTQSIDTPPLSAQTGRPLPGRTPR